MEKEQYRNEKWLKEQFDLYKTPTEVSRATGYPRTCITRYAKRFGIYESKFNRKQKLQFDFNYFNVIDSADKAYFLGFIMADGCMYQKKDKSKAYQFSIKLSEKDSDIIEKFCEHIGFPKDKIRYRSGIRQGHECKAVEVQINDQVFCNHLLNKGIVPQKTGQEYMPDCNGFEIDFIRGFIDGDGWIYDRTKDENKFRFEIGYCSTSENIMNDINNFLIINYDISMNYTESKAVMSHKTTAKNKVFKLINNIYYDNCIALNRKLQTARQIQEKMNKDLF